jgi:hypothetical protein
VFGFIAALVAIILLVMVFRSQSRVGPLYLVGGAATAAVLLMAWLLSK